MERFPPENRYPQDTAEQLSGDGAFVGVDMMLAPERLPPGFLAYMENCVCVDGDCRLRPGAFLMPWAKFLTWPSVPLDSGLSRAFWSATVNYDDEDEVIYSETVYRADGAIAAGGTAPDANPSWTATSIAIKKQYVQVYPTSEPALGVGTYHDTSGQVFFVNIGVTEANLSRQYNEPLRLFIPPSLQNDEQQVFVTQAYNALILWRGPSLDPLVWDGDRTNRTFTRLRETSTPGDDGLSWLPNAEFATFFADRLWVPFQNDQIAISNVGTYRYDAAARVESVSKGGGGKITAIVPFDRTTLLVFKENSIWRLANVYGDLSAMRQEIVHARLGTQAGSSVVIFGGRVGFMADDGYRTIDPLDADRFNLPDRPLSYPITPLIDRIVWSRAAQIQAAIAGGYLYVAVPISRDDKQAPPVENNAILVFDIDRGAWQGLWTADSWKVKRFVFGRYMERLRLFFWNSDNRLFLLGEGNQDQDDPEQGQNNDVPIVGKIWTRGFAQRQVERDRQLRLRLNYQQQDATITAKAAGPGVTQEQTLLDARSYSNTAGPRGTVYDESNVNGDFLKPGRKNYSHTLPGPEGALYLTAEGVPLDLQTDLEETASLSGEGRWTQARLEVSGGLFSLVGVRYAGLPGNRNQFSKVG